MTTNSSFLKNDYLGAFQIFKIAKFSKSKEPSDDDSESIMDFWCPMFETISPIKIGFLVVFVVLSGLKPKWFITTIYLYHSVNTTQKLQTVKYQWNWYKWW